MKQSTYNILLLALFVPISISYGATHKMQAQVEVDSISFPEIYSDADAGSSTTTPVHIRRKRTIVPTGYKRCPKGSERVEGLFHCVPSQGFVLPPSLRQRPSNRPTTRNGESSTTAAMKSVPVQPPPEALHQTTEWMPVTVSTVMPTESTDIYNALPSTKQGTYGDDKDESFNEVLSTKREELTSEIPAHIAFSENESGIGNSRTAKEIVHGNVENYHTTLTMTTQVPLPEVDLAFIKLRQLRSRSRVTSVHRNCKHHYDVRFHRDSEIETDDDYD